MLSPYEIERLADALAAKVADRLASVSAADAWLDLHQAADLLNCSTSTIERLARAGKLPSRKFDRLRRYRRSDLLALNEKGGRDHAE